jgi:hypothetical protein
MTDEQRKIEGMYQRAMDLRDATPGNLPKREESRYTKAYMHAFKQSHDVTFFRAMTKRIPSLAARKEGRAMTQGLDRRKR